MPGQSKWRDGRPMALLFAATVALPSLALAALAYRALDSDRQLEERVWRERMQDAVRGAYGFLERRILDTRGHVEALARGEQPRAERPDGLISVVLSPQIKLSPSSAFAWMPDGLASHPELPAELEQAEIRDLRLPNAGQAIQSYEELLQRAPAQWRGWIHVRLARAYSRAGQPAKATAALRSAARLPESPGAVPTRFAARFELASASGEESAQLYRDLNSGAWLLEKSPYAFYEMRLREWAGGRIPSDILASEQSRQAMSRLLERISHGESGRLTEGPVSALVMTSSHSRSAATITLESQLRSWLDEAAKAIPAELALQSGAPPPPDVSLAPPLSLATLGLPGAIWAVPRDPAAPRRANDNRRRLLLAILILVAGVLVFGSFATLRLVRRELKVAKLQSDFAATVSHEFRSPLTGIRQLGEMLLAGRAANDEPRRRQYYELICRESDRLTRLVENVLDFSRIEDGAKQYQFDRIDTAEWLRGLAGIAEQRGSPLQAVVPAGLPVIQGDREALSSAVLNLLDNAIKYSPHGSPVSLRASGGNGWVTIEVQDRGCGIAPDEQRHIFDRFYRGANASGGPAKGVGLGLALVKRIGDAHGARIRVESTPGEGTTFYFSLKAAI